MMDPRRKKSGAVRADSHSLSWNANGRKLKPSLFRLSNENEKVIERDLLCLCVGMVKFSWKVRALHVSYGSTSWSPDMPNTFQSRAGFTVRIKRGIHPNPA